MSNVESKKQNKGIQCKECESFGHIQFECANTLKKKSKYLKTTWSDEESYISEEEYYRVSNYIIFQVTFEKDVIVTVTTDVVTSKTVNSNFDEVATCVQLDLEYNEDSDSDNSDEKEPST